MSSFCALYIGSIIGKLWNFNVLYTSETMLQIFTEDWAGSDILKQVGQLLKLI
jgi:hypothetical protein